MATAVPPPGPRAACCSAYRRSRGDSFGPPGAHLPASTLLFWRGDVLATGLLGQADSRPQGTVLAQLANLTSMERFIPARTSHLDVHGRK